MAIYVLVTAIIEGPSIVILYSLGYPNSPSSNWIHIYAIATNAFFIMLAMSAIGGYPAQANQGPRDISLDLVYGAISMLIIVALTGETINWLCEKIAEIRGKKDP